MPQMYSSMLVVAADNELRRIWIDGFRGRGWTVYEAHDLRSAIAAAIQSQPYVVITTVELPGTVGFHYLRSIRTTVEHDVKIVGVVTNAATSGDLRGADFDIVLQAPLNIDEIHLVIAPKSELDDRATTSMPPLKKPS